MNTELIHYLDEIAQRSLGGDIVWSQPNPSTFQWLQEADGERFYVTIQRAGRRRPKGLLEQAVQNEASEYLFQVQDRTTRQTILSLSTSERPETTSVLSNIYDNATRGMDIQATNVLKKLLRS